MKKILVSVIVILISIMLFSAGTENIISELGYSAKLTGKGETGYIYNNSASTIKINPSLMSSLNNTNLTWTHSELNHNQWNDYISAGVPLKVKGINLGLGFSWNRLWVDGIPVTETGDTISGTDYLEIINNGNTNMTMNEYGIGLSFNKNIINAGLLVKYTQGSLLDYSVKGLGFDGGITIIKNMPIPVIHSIGTAVVIKDIGGTKYDWNTGYSEKTDMIAEVGVGTSLDIPKLGEESINLELAVNKYMGDNTDIIYKAGAEIYLLPVIPMRIGYNGQSITGGIGIETDYITVDYSYSGMQDLEPVHKVSLGLLFP